MIRKNEYIGLAYNGESLSAVTARLSKKRIWLNRFDRLELIEALGDASESGGLSPGGGDEADEDDIFGISDEVESTIPVVEDEEEEDVDLGLEELDLDDNVEDEGDLDLVDEAGRAPSNEILLYEYLTSEKKKRQHVAINILSGNTIFQFLKDTDYSKVKKKELQEVVQSKLHSVYGEIPPRDRYSYFVRENGSLSIASLDHEPPTLTLLNQVNELSSNKIFIEDVTPDEVALTGLFRLCFPEEDEKITSLIQFGPRRSRIIFLRGHEVLQVSPVINEGTRNKNFLNTIFSKILFQLDTGEVPGLERIVLADNSVGYDAIDFFRQNFPDLEVIDFPLDPELFVYDEEHSELVREHTTAIAVSVRALGYRTELYPQLSLLPDYVLDRQKVFKLQWHGILILIAIGISPILLNHYYQKFDSEIEQLQSETTRVEGMIAELVPVAEQAEILEEMLVVYQGQLVLMEELTRGTMRWTTTLDRFNRAVSETGGIWITTFRQADNGIVVEGYSMDENRIPILSRQFSTVTLQNVRGEEMRER
ncbi:MAG: PilN domain-containing protein, partial [Balneolaceae bacterium]